jgi:hypothetical protein
VPALQWFGPLPSAAVAQRKGSQDYRVRCVLLRYPSDFLIVFSVPPLLLMKKDAKMGDFRHVPQTISL